MTTTKQPAEHAAWYALSAEEAARTMNVEADRGLGAGEVTRRLAEYGPNELPTEPPPSVWVVARGQLANPMKIMLLIVCAASFAIAQVATGIVVLVHSEVGRLRRVMVHRPTLEHTRLTPSNAEELLFDDVLWVARAKAEHDMFCEVMRDRGVEVYHAERLLAEALAEPGVRDWASEHILNELEVSIVADRAREWAQTADAALVAEFLIGAITKADVAQNLGLVWESADPTSMLLPPPPNLLFQRDPSCWIYDGVTLNPMTKPARKPETMIMEAIYRFHPMFAAEEFPIWLGGISQDWGRAHIEGGDVQPIGQRHRDDAWASAPPRRPCCGSPARCSGPGRRPRCSRCTCPSLAATCTWTRSSRCATATWSPCSRRWLAGRAPGRSGRARRPATWWWRSSRDRCPS